MRRPSRMVLLFPGLGPRRRHAAVIPRSAGAVPPWRWQRGRLWVSPERPGGGSSAGSGTSSPTPTGGTGGGFTLPDPISRAAAARRRPRPVRGRDPQGGDCPARPHAAARQLRIDGRAGRHALEVADGAVGAVELRLGSQVRRAERRAAVLSPVHDLHDRRRLPARRRDQACFCSRRRSAPARRVRRRRPSAVAPPTLLMVGQPYPPCPGGTTCQPLGVCTGNGAALHQRRPALSHGRRHLRGAAQVLRGRRRRPRLRGCPLRDAGGAHPAAADGPGRR